jgi:hypothetical protein
MCSVFGLFRIRTRTSPSICWSQRHIVVVVIVVDDFVVVEQLIVDIVVDDVVIRVVVRRHRVAGAFVISQRYSIVDLDRIEC